MSGYLGQEGRNPYSHYRHDPERLISPEEAETLLELAQHSRDSAAASFILTAAEEGWRINYPREGGLFQDYDRVVGTHIINRVSDEPVFVAFSELVARSLGLEPVDDGR